MGLELDLRPRTQYEVLSAWKHSVAARGYSETVNFTLPVTFRFQAINMVTLFTFDLHKNALFAAFCSRLLTGYSQLMASTSLALRVFMKVSKMAAKAGSQTCDA